jgi:hypothetical protein
MHRCRLGIAGQSKRTLSRRQTDAAIPATARAGTRLSATVAALRSPGLNALLDHPVMGAMP